MATYVSPFAAHPRILCPQCRVAVTGLHGLPARFDEPPCPIPGLAEVWEVNPCKHPVPSSWSACVREEVDLRLVYYPRDISGVLDGIMSKRYTELQEHLDNLCSLQLSDKASDVTAATYWLTCVVDQMMRLKPSSALPEKPSPAEMSALMLNRWWEPYSTVIMPKPPVVSWPTAAPISSTVESGAVVRTLEVVVAALRSFERTGSETVYVASKAFPGLDVQALIAKHNQIREDLFLFCAKPEHRLTEDCLTFLATYQSSAHACGAKVNQAPLPAPAPPEPAPVSVSARKRRTFRKIIED